MLEEIEFQAIKYKLLRILIILQFCISATRERPVYYWPWGIMGSAVVYKPCTDSMC